MSIWLTAGVPRRPRLGCNRAGLALRRCARREACRDPCLFLEASPKVSVRGIPCPSYRGQRIAFSPEFHRNGLSSSRLPKGIYLFHLSIGVNQRQQQNIHPFTPLRRPYTRLTRSIRIAASLSNLKSGSLSESRLGTRLSFTHSQ